MKFNLEKIESAAHTSLSRKKSLIFPIILSFIAGLISGFLILGHDSSNNANRNLEAARIKISAMEDDLKNSKAEVDRYASLLEKYESENSVLRQQNENLALRFGKNGGREYGNKQQPEELSPGFNVCASNAATDLDLKNCYEDAREYWDRKLNIAYNALMQLCKKDEYPKECINKMRKMELGWINFQDIMGNYIYTGGLFGGGGTIDRVNGIAFLAEETKRQYERIKKLAQ